MAAKHLIESGHKDIGCITGPLSKHQAEYRFNGFKTALLENDIPLNQNWIIESDFECKGGYESFTKLQERGALPSAIFVCNDMMAMGVINAANEAGIRIPEDLSIIGYDDIHIAQYMTPALTTIHQPKYRLGQAAVNTLLQRLEKEIVEPTVVQLEPTLMTRKSVKIL